MTLTSWGRSARTMGRFSRSAYHGQWKEIAAAGTSLVQMNANCVVARKAYLPLPLDLEQSAAAAERYGMPWCDKLAGGGLSMITDCQSVLAEWEKPLRLFAGRSRFAGLLVIGLCRSRRRPSRRGNLVTHRCLDME